MDLEEELLVIIAFVHRTFAEPSFSWMFFQRTQAVNQWLVVDVGGLVLQGKSQSLS